MSTLKRFYRNVLQNRTAFISGTNTDRIHSLELESHLTTNTYGNFTLTDAIRPSMRLTIIPEQGYKYGRIKLDRNDTRSFHRINPRWLMPILVVSVSLEQLFDTFLDLLDPMGDTVDIVLETSHRYTGTHRLGLCREHIDLPVLKSFLCDHEDLMLNDGCTGISVCEPRTQTEVKFDEHKLIYVRARTLLPFESILHSHGVPHKEMMPILSDAEHVHITREEYIQRLKTLKVSLGMEEIYTSVC